MRKVSFIPLVAAAFVLTACGTSSVYPLFPAEVTSASSASFEKGYRHEHGLGVTRNYAAALASYAAGDASGDVRATNSLGVMALEGRGQRMNFGKAYRLFSKAAAAGSATARFNLGLMYDLGLGRSPSPENAAREYRIAAEMGHHAAQFRLSEILRYGHGVPANPAEADRLFAMSASGGNFDALKRIDELRGGVRQMDAKAARALFAVDNCTCATEGARNSAARASKELRALASSGDVAAQYNLAVRLMNGNASHADESEAARLFTAAARGGYAPAQRQLAQMYLRGQAVGHSKVIAHAWLNLASRDTGVEGHSARAEMEGLERSMTVAEIARAQKASRDGSLGAR